MTDEEQGGDMVLIILGRVRTWGQQALAAQCVSHGGLLRGLPSSVLGGQLLWALANNESCLGKNCTPRHEPAFDLGGAYGPPNKIMTPLIARYPPAPLRSYSPSINVSGDHTPDSLVSPAACSYGPWQQMFCNALPGSTPDSFDDLDWCTRSTVYQLNTLLSRFKPQTLAAIGECWNAGHPMITPSVGVARYVHNLLVAYALPLP
jgi:hypothetical protein